ncbi:PIN domain-like protein [Mycena maculata]|uniref:PIN domain-like protein n=1 Tax=Mycena maculata TaxID=230809 RepID=A0AAD7K3P5_9AGAR|nr:PIN domain-like protein [Mycena maculata]
MLEFAVSGGYPKLVGVDASTLMYQVERENPTNGHNTHSQALFYQLARLLSLPINFVFVFDGVARRLYRRSSRAHAGRPRLTAQFQELIQVLGYQWYTAPGEAEAELGRLSQLKIIHAAMTSDANALIFGAEELMILPNQNDEDKLTVYTSSKIFITPGVRLSRGGLLLIALLTGDEIHNGLAGCGPSFAHAVAHGELGDLLMRMARDYPQFSEEFLEVLESWKLDLAEEFATDPHGYLGSKQMALARLIMDSPSFPDLHILYGYTCPITSWSENYSPPAYQSWGLPKPDLEKIASFCKLQFGWDASTISSIFVKCVYSGIALQSLLKPYDLHLHALLEAHVNSGVSFDDDFPRSSVVRSKSTPSVKLYHVEISTGALSLRVKSGIQDASAFPTANRMRIWIPTSIMDYALPDLVSRSKASSKSRLQGRFNTVSKPMAEGNA